MGYPIQRLYLGGHYDGRWLECDSDMTRPHAKCVRKPRTLLETMSDILSDREPDGRVEHYEPHSFWRNGHPQELCFALTTLTEPERLALWRKHRRTF